MSNTRYLIKYKFDEPLSQAILNNDITFVKDFVPTIPKASDGCTPRIYVATSESNVIFTSAIGFAAERGLQEMVDFLKAYASSACIVNAYSSALKYGKLEVANSLQTKENVKLLDDVRETLLFKAVHLNATDNVRALLALGADPNVARTIGGLLPLQIAASINTVEPNQPNGKAYETIKVLLEYNADPFLPNQGMSSPVSWCAYHRSFGAIMLLLTKADKHSSAYHEGLLSMTHEVIAFSALKQFVELGFSLNFFDESGNSFFKRVAYSRSMARIKDKTHTSFKITLDIYDLLLDKGSEKISAQQMQEILGTLKDIRASYIQDEDFTDISTHEECYQAICQKLTSLINAKKATPLTQAIQAAGGSPIHARKMPEPNEPELIRKMAP